MFRFTSLLLRNTFRTLPKPIPFLRPHMTFSPCYHFSPNPTQKESHSSQNNDPASDITRYQKMLETFRSGSTSSLSKEEAMRGLSILFKLANAYQKNSDFSQALKHYQEALLLAEKAGLADTTEAACIHNGIADTYLRQDKLDEAQASLDKESNILGKSGSDNDVRSRVVKNLYLKGTILERKGQFDKALEVYKEALKETSGLSGEELANDLLAIYDGMGYICRNKGDIAQASDNWKKAGEIAIKQYGEGSTEARNVQENLIWALVDQGKYDEAISQANKLGEASEKKFGSESAEKVESLLLVGRVYKSQGELGKGIESFEKAVKVLEKNPGKYPQQLSYVYMLLAKAYWGKNEGKKAKEMFEKCVKTVKDAFGEQDQTLAKYYSSWGELLKKNILTMEEAKGVLKKALEICEKSGNKDIAARVYSGLGEIAFYDDDYEESLRCYKEFAKTDQEGKGNQELCEEVYSAMGNIYYKQEKYDESTKFHEKAIKACEEVEKDHSNLDFHYRNLAEAYEKRGMLEKAREVYQKNLELAVRRHGKEDETTVRSAGLVADVLGRLNRHEEAGKLLKEYGKK